MNYGMMIAMYDHEYDLTTMMMIIIIMILMMIMINLIIKREMVKRKDPKEW